MDHLRAAWAARIAQAESLLPIPQVGQRFLHKTLVKADHRRLEPCVVIGIAGSIVTYQDSTGTRFTMPIEKWPEVAQQMLPDYTAALRPHTDHTKMNAAIERWRANPKDRQRKRTAGLELRAHLAILHGRDSRTDKRLAFGKHTFEDMIRIHDEDHPAGYTGSYEAPVSHHQVSSEGDLRRGSSPRSSEGRSHHLGAGEAVSLTTAEVFEIAARFGAQARDRGLVESAVGRQQWYDDPFMRAAALMHSLARNHPFDTANKRVAWVAARTLLLQMGYDVTADSTTVEDFLDEVAVGSVEVLAIAVWLSERA